MSNNNAAYSRAIDLLMAGTVDYKQLAVNLAKSHPTIFVRMADAASTPKVENWHRDVARLIKAGQKVEAIKTTRTATGLGLKEAKDIADNVQNELFNRGMVMTGYEGAYTLSGELLAVAQAIAAGA